MYKHCTYDVHVMASTNSRRRPDIGQGLSQRDDPVITHELLRFSTKEILGRWRHPQRNTSCHKAHEFTHGFFFVFLRISTTRNKNKNFKKKREQNRRIRLSGTRSDQSINLIMRREAYNRQPASDRNEEEALNYGQGINRKIGEL